ncbi:MAG: hypothetical protein ACRC67_24300, partial [Inquilinus sp.]|uniref:hypothetical protein n=1 Tax=Inquilinus sp. TaxID=1932117 RepID=UPI003F2EB313
MAIVVTMALAIGGIVGSYVTKLRERGLTAGARSKRCTFDRSNLTPKLDPALPRGSVSMRGGTAVRCGVGESDEISVIVQ